MQTNVGDLLTAESVRASYLYLAMYAYTGEVLENNNLLSIFPSTDKHQMVEFRQFLTIPSGREVEFTDIYGNTVRRSIIDSPHHQLVLATAGRVRLRPLGEAPPDAPLGVALNAPTNLQRFLAPSPLVDPQTLEQKAREVTAGRQTLLQSVEAVVSWVHSSVQYGQGHTTVATHANQVMEIGWGVCQDFAHLTLAMLRALWIPCRYVSGLLTEEVGQTHAWVEFWHPDAGWITCDPTRNKAIVLGPDHVKFAAGRDYSDVPPVMGEFIAGGTGALDKVIAEAKIEQETATLDEAISMALDR